MTKGRPISPFHPAVVMATWFWTGLSPKAPGTIGSLAALPFGFAIFYFFGEAALALAILTVFCIGLLATKTYLNRTGKSDPGEVVIDEVAGQWIPLLIAGSSPLLYALSFAFFRLFDIWKPWPISWMDKNIKGAFGVMIDDIIAGIFAFLLLYLVKQVIS